MSETNNYFSLNTDLWSDERAEYLYCMEIFPEGYDLLEAAGMLPMEENEGERLYKIIADGKKENLNTFETVKRIIAGRKVLLEFGVASHTRVHRLGMEIIYLREKLIYDYLRISRLIEQYHELSPFILHYLILRFKLLLSEFNIRVKLFKRFCKQLIGWITVKMGEQAKRLKNLPRVLKLLAQLENFKGEGKKRFLKIRNQLEHFIIHFRITPKVFKKIQQRLIGLSPYVLPFVILLSSLKERLKFLGLYEFVAYIPDLIRFIPFLSSLRQNQNAMYALILVYFLLFHSGPNSILKRYYNFSNEFLDQGRRATFFFLLAMAYDTIEQILPAFIRVFIFLSDVFFLKFYYINRKGKKYNKVTFLRLFKTFTSRKKKNIDPEAEIELGKYEAYIAELLSKLQLSISYYIFIPFATFLITALLYNCCYYILYNKKPYIPLLSGLEENLEPKDEKN